MNNIKITKDKIESLEFQTNHCYEAYKKAVKTQSQFDADWLNNISIPLGISLSNAISKNISDWTRSDILDRYILQYALLSGPYIGPLELTSTVRLDEDKIKEFIDNRDNSFAQIKELAQEIKNDGRYRMIINIVDYVRKKYPKPSLK